MCIRDSYTLAENRGSTSYVIPDNEAYGTIYTVTFKATVGYEGSATLVTSNSVKEKQKSRYTTPIANDIIMETIDDMSFKVRMSKGEGQYQFCLLYTSSVSIPGITCRC